MTRWIREHGRAVVALLAALFVALAAALTDNQITWDEAVMIAIAVANALVVYVAPNYPGATWVKTAAAAILAGLQAVQGYLSGGLTPAELVLVGVAVLGVLAVAVAPSLSDPQVMPAHRG